MNNQNKEYGLKSRNLGGEWEEWNGQIEKNQGKTSASPSLFLTILTFFTLILIGITTSIYYFINIQHQNSHFSLLTFWVYISFLLSFVISYTLFMFTVWLKKPFAFFLKEKQYADCISVKMTLLFGAKLGIPQDRLLNSMLQVGNILTNVFYSHVEKEELLILTPRCLARPIRYELNRISAEKGITCKIAAGGTEARDILKEKKPKAIIAVACERDLYAGVKDVPPHIPVIAIANARPEGPCRNTTINIDELEKAINFFVREED